MKNHYKFQIFSSFWLKLFAILAMTIDHLGVVMDMFLDHSKSIVLIISIFRIIGRFALPLFCFMIVEGVLHTRSFKRYIIALLSVGALVFGGHIFLVEVMNGNMGQGNIFFDLALGAIAIKCLDSKKVQIKFLSLLPIGYCLFSHLTYGIIPELGNFPEYFQTQYGFYGMALILGFYTAHHLTKIYYDSVYSKNGFTAEELKDTPQYKLTENLFKTLSLVIVTMLLYVITIYGKLYIKLDVSIQTWAILSGALLLLYNGNRGYNSNWFKYGCYIYYPAHLLILYGLFYLIAYI
jgi:hypothetical protein